MPTYEYRCPKCGITYGVERSIHAEADAPMCQTNCNTLMDRVWTSPPVKFNSTGFYSTDNAKFMS